MRLMIVLPLLALRSAVPPAAVAPAGIPAPPAAIAAPAESRVVAPEILQPANEEPGPEEEEGCG